MPRVFLGLGSNDDDRVSWMRRAHRTLSEAAEMRVLETSPLYESEPWESEPGTGVDEQRWYLNCVISVETSLAPAELLARDRQRRIPEHRLLGAPKAARARRLPRRRQLLVAGEQGVQLRVGLRADAAVGAAEPVPGAPRRGGSLLVEDAVVTAGIERAEGVVPKHQLQLPYRRAAHRRRSEREHPLELAQRLRLDGHRGGA
jgi:hypothetical protein